MSQLYVDMTKTWYALCLVAVLLFHSGLAQAKDYQTIDWTALLPKADLDALLNPPEALNQIEDGSPEDQLANEVYAAIKQGADSAYQQALVSTNVVAELNGKAVRLPTYIVPLEFGETAQQVTSFFLVPYFGACIHVPPPPPNQIIYGEYKPGLKLESLYETFWISGVLSTSLTENDTATSAYSMKVEKVEPYDG